MEIRKFSPQRRVAFFLLNLGAGGVERVVTTLLPEFSKMGVEYIVICLNGSDSFYPITEAANIYSLRDLYDTNKSFHPSIFFHLFAPFLLGNLLWSERIDCVLSFLPLPNLLNVLCSLWSRRKRHILLSERASPRELLNASKWYLRLVYRLSIKYAYPLADHVIAISSGIKEDLIRLGVPGSKISVIYNPIKVDSDGDSLIDCGSKPIEAKYFLCVGRHEYQKGFDVAIKAFKLLISANNAFSDYKLLIVGTGSRTSSLALLVHQLFLDDHVVFIHQSKTVQALMAGAEMFWFPSRFEGFGNVLTEAILSKVLICSTDCRHGPREILVHYDGLLARPDSVHDFYANLCRLLSLPRLKRATLIEESYTSLYRFEPSKIAGEYYSCIFSYGC